MRLLSSVAIITLCEVLRSNAAPNGPDIEKSVDHAASSSISYVDLEARRREALELVIDLAKSDSIAYYNIFRGNTAETHAYPILVHFFYVNFLTYGTEKSRLEILGSNSYEPRTILLGIQTLIDTLNNDIGGNLRVRNKIYVLPGFTLEREDADLAKAYFRASIDTFDFQNGSSTGPEIGGSSTEQSASCTTELLTELKFSPNPKVIFVSAVHFEGLWRNGFDSSRRTFHFFHVYGKTDSVLIETMNIYGWSRHGLIRINGLPVRYVELPHKTTNRRRGLSMWIFCPKSDEAYEQLLDQWHTIDIQQLAAKRSSHYLNVYVPEFKIETTSTLAFSTDSRTSSPDSDRYENKAVLEVKRPSTNQEMSGPRIEEYEQQIDKFVVDRPFVVIVTTKGAVSIPIIIAAISGSALEPAAY